LRQTPNKVKVVLNIKSTINIKEMQKLCGGIVALGRFVKRLADKCLLFFKVSKKKTCFR